MKTSERTECQPSCALQAHLGHLDLHDWKRRRTVAPEATSDLMIFLNSLLRPKLLQAKLPSHYVYHVLDVKLGMPNYLPATRSLMPELAFDSFHSCWDHMISCELVLIKHLRPLRYLMCIQYTKSTASLTGSDDRKEIYTPLAANEAERVDRFVHCPSSFNLST